MGFTTWHPIETPPVKAGYYLVGNSDTHEVAQARYIPKKKQWKFPSARMAFEVQAWADMPTI